MSARARTVILLALWWLGGTSLAAAQVPERGRADSLAEVLHRLTARIDSLESGHCPDTTRLALPAPSGNARADSLLAVTAELDRRLRALRDQRCAGAAPAAPTAPTAPADTTDELAAIRAAAAGAAGGAAAAPGAPADTSAAPPPAPEPQAPRNASALNPEISATGDIRLVAREGHQHDNGVAREFEVGLQSTLDPYSTAKIFLSFEHDEVGVEEGYLYWTGLPGRLRVDVGKFRQQVGDLNRWHLHALPETEYPLVYQRFLAPEGLSGVGVSLYTTLPVSLLGGTHEIWVQGTTAESETLYGDGHEPSLLLRLQNFWQLNRSTYGQIGITGVGGNDRGQRSPEPAGRSRRSPHLASAGSRHPARSDLPGRGVPAPCHGNRRHHRSLRHLPGSRRPAQPPLDRWPAATTGWRRRAAPMTPSGGSRRP